MTDKTSTEIARDEVVAALVGQSVVAAELGSDGDYIVIETTGGVRLYADSPTAYAVEARPNLAIAAVEAEIAKVRTNRRRAYLYVAWDRELRDVNQLRYAAYDPYEQDDEWVNERWDSEIPALVDGYLTGEDWETLDQLQGEADALAKVLAILKGEEVTN